MSMTEEGRRGQRGPGHSTISGIHPQKERAKWDRKGERAQRERYQKILKDGLDDWRNRDDGM
jgi:hypothetical protein